jgi:hypothetical protein
MTHDTRKLIDDLWCGDVLEIDYYGMSMEDKRTSVGVFEGYCKNESGDWVLRRVNRPDLAFIDIVEIRVLTPAGSL